MRIPFQSGGKQRLAQGKEKLIALHLPETLVSQLCVLLADGSSSQLSRLRPYKLADEWQAPRKDVLLLCLQATRAGLLELQWEFFCPLCREPQDTTGSLAQTQSVLHCEVCSLDFPVHLDESVELTFRPNPSVRKVAQPKQALSDDGLAVTAAAVTALQAFRDLFSSEALRPGLPISVGTMTVAFTDLKGSTKMYQEIGDAPAFGLVIDHFDVIKAAIAKYDGAIVKNIGDAIMAVFQRPANAIKAMLEVQAKLAAPSKKGRSLTLRSGMHLGPCIAVNLNERMDYFGTTVNKAARLEGKSSGNDVVISDEVYNDPEVQQMLGKDGEFKAEAFADELKGFAGKAPLHRISYKKDR